MEFQLPDRSTTLGSGDAAMSAQREVLGHEAKSDIRMMWCTVAHDSLPPDLIHSESFPAFLPRTQLVNGYLAFLRTLIEDRMQVDNTPGLHLENAILGLQIGVLAERRRFSERGDRRLAGLREQMEFYIESNLQNPGLSPQVVASGVGVSLRYAHQVFNRNGETLAAAIRTRRVGRVAAELRFATKRPSASELARIVGFANSENLGRAFRREYGISMSEFWRLRRP